METLFITKHPWLPEVHLKDANGFKIGTFILVDEAIDWCRKNNYKFIIT